MQGRATPGPYVSSVPGRELQNRQQNFRIGQLRDITFLVYHAKDFRIRYPVCVVGVDVGVG